MNLGQQIDTLLKRQTAVYVKGLGVFSRVHTSAIFDSKNKVYLPPISHIEFDHFSTEGYDFLAYLQEVNQLDKASAEQQLSDVITAIQDQIQQFGEVTLDSLGTLVSYGNSFVFKALDLSGFQYTAVESAGFDKDETSSGIQISESHPVVAEDTLEQQKLPLVDDTLSVIDESSSSNVEDKAVIEEVPVPEDQVVSEETEQSVARESNSYIYGVIAAIALLLLGGIYYYVTYYKPSEAVVLNTPVPIVDTIPVDTLLDTIQVGADSVSMAQDTIKEEVVPVKVLPKKEEGVNHKFIIVIGTHITLEQAEAEAASYNKKGHKSVRVLSPNLSKNKKRVIWDTYPTREKRDSALREVRKHYKEDAWGTEI